MSEGKLMDWTGAIERLKRIGESLEQAGVPTADRTHKILEERAARLAKAEDAAAPLAADMLIIFGLAGERYAFPVSEVTGILSEFRLTPVPGAPRGIAGIMQVRGDIWPVYRLHERLGLPDGAASGPGVVLLMQTEGGRRGVQADGVEEIRAVNQRERRPGGDGLHVAWMTDDLVRVLDSASLWTKEL
jgi:purine-binding chemotaxis protein CheW